MWTYLLLKDKSQATIITRSKSRYENKLDAQKPNFVNGIMSVFFENIKCNFLNSKYTDITAKLPLNKATHRITYSIDSCLKKALQGYN